MPRILVIDDDPAIGKLLFNHFEEMGYITHRVVTSEDALNIAAIEPYDVIFLDVRLPDGSGLDIIGQLKNTPGRPEVVIITGYGEPDGAELAITSGAWDYLEKPFKLKDVTLLLMRVIEHRERRQRNVSQNALKREGLVGQSPQIVNCLGQVFEAAQVDASVLLFGETGTGKELFARAIHNNSRRADKPFLAVDCAALPETLAESVLFGHERGAFTGAHASQEGMIAQANGGTLFLDEIGELSPAMQAKLLRVLQERVYRPVGGRRDLASDFRLVAATNRQLEIMAEEGRFRTDLLFRLRAFPIDLPPLRTRKEDIKDICDYHIGRLCGHYAIEAKGFSRDFFEAIEGYDWPGNVRELVGALEYAIGAAFAEPILCPHHLPKNLRAKIAKQTITHRNNAHAEQEGQQTQELLTLELRLPPFRQWRVDHINRMEREYLGALIAQSEGDLRQALELSELSRSRLYDLLAKHGMKLG
ncbi:putative two component, sigma54 specific, transcriptional regulator, Fis family [Desulfarculus baarsii DSM 2075]|uniref:Two component, sigma54 specific, transcriptional regulator, Fis family n=1 Tax=Desulfarculus baarsii (strain ATCC 33931 / DSM 2075 / LMG 7858 / VKM B-1802 / 2st14) TaxID=644282 RepID=E1QGB9_DESB2|nr:sigma-54 dependent transcriptional regulator [Desulfarculus baarsii]ADK83631.1 putative two component, sigma54 specific, transcriptional regulator, Fis family [Desulfarculus baarsii DSM 2075]